MESLKQRIDLIKEHDNTIKDYEKKERKKRTVNADSDLSEFFGGLIYEGSNTQRYACGVRNSSEIFMDYQEKFYRDVFFPYLEEHGYKKDSSLGDYYENRTSINFKALNHNRRIFLDVLRDRGIHMDIIPGNHDVYYKNTNKLNALKELLGHYMNEVRIIEKPEVIQYGSLNVALIPWINPENEEKTNAVY